MEKLTDLPNIGPVLADHLTRAGIETPERLREIGAEEAFLRIRAQVDATACLHELEALAGAVAGVRKSLLPDERKAELKAWFRGLCPMVRRAERKDLPDVAALAVKLWPRHAVRELLEEFEVSVQESGAQFFLKELEGVPVGFAQCQLRHDYVEGTESSPVGYLEGIFILEEHRRKGFARELLAACEEWARAQGCREFASDCELDNGDSFLFHQGAGFTETNRIICFAKKL